MCAIICPLLSSSKTEKVKKQTKMTDVPVVETNPGKGIYNQREKKGITEK